MYRCRLFFAALLAVFLLSCKATQYHFNSDTMINADARQRVAEAVKKKHLAVARVDVYQATLAEQLVDENSVSEYTLRNTLSKKNHIDIERERYRHEIFFYLFTATLASGEPTYYGLLFTTTHHKGQGYIGVGPAYAGELNRKEDNQTYSFLAESRLHIGRNDQNEPFLKSNETDAVALNFYFDRRPMPARGFRFTQVINEAPNKISGINKKLIYNVAEIFNDVDALAFTYINTLSLK